MSVEYIYKLSSKLQKMAQDVQINVEQQPFDTYMISQKQKILSSVQEIALNNYQIFPNEFDVICDFSSGKCILRTVPPKPEAERLLNQQVSPSITKGLAQAGITPERTKVQIGEVSFEVE